jgi:hypothetical protein
MGHGDFNVNLPEGENFSPSEERVSELNELLSEQTFHLGYPCSNREEWDRVANSDSGKRILEEARVLADEKPLPSLNNEIYLRCVEKKDRREVDSIRPNWMERMALLPIAECIDPSVGYLEQIEKDIQNLAELKVWTFPGHPESKEFYEGKGIFTDLSSVHYAADLVAADYFLGDRLKSETRKMIRDELDRRIFQPFEQRIKSGQDVYWWVTCDHNWNSVCLAEILVCALHLKEDKKERAWYVALSEKLIQYSEEGFTESGFYTEGVGYWAYGFSHYVLISELVRAVTKGEIDWLKKPLVEKMSSFGTRMEIQEGAYPTFSDCKSDVVLPAWLVNWMNNRVEESRVTRSTETKIDSLKGMHFKFPPMLALILFGQVDINQAYARKFGDSEKEIRNWFEDVQFLICRPSDQMSVRFAATFKGGHNGANHNHNDLGTFTVLIGNKELLTDPGAEVYTKRTFSKHRYVGDLLNSFGHPVPVIAGELQVPGKDWHVTGYGKHAYTTILDESFTDASDHVVLDLKKAYPVETLEKLTRAFTYQRSGVGSIEVVDEVGYSKPETFETALITYADWSRNEDGSIRISDDDATIEVIISTEDGELEFSHTVIEESSTPTRLSWRFKKPISHARTVISVRPMVETTS